MAWSGRAVKFRRSQADPVTITTLGRRKRGAAGTRGTLTVLNYLSGFDLLEVAKQLQLDSTSLLSSVINRQGTRARATGAAFHS
jgi:hypothetical protein